MRPHFLLFAIVGLASWSAAQAVPAKSSNSGGTKQPPPKAVCGDITRLDVRNTTLHAAGQTFEFHDGIAVNGPLEEARIGGRTEPRHEWTAEIELDTTVHAAPDVPVRFLLIHNSHETGSGWRYYLVGFRCAEGRLQQVFNAQGLALKTVRLDSTGVTLQGVERAGSTAPAIARYAWNGKKYTVEIPSAK